MSVSAAQTLVAGALGRDGVAPTDGIATLAEWDSLGHMHIVLAIEAARGQQLSPEQIVSIGTVSDVAACLDE